MLTASAKTRSRRDPLRGTRSASLCEISKRSAKLRLRAGMGAQIKAVHRTMRCKHQTMRCLHPSHLGINDPVGVSPTWERPKGYAERYALALASRRARGVQAFEETSTA